MKKLKSVLSLVLALSMALAVSMTGCSSKKADTGTTGNTVTSGKTNESQKSTGDVKLVWYSLGDQPDDLQKVLDKVNPLIKQKIGVTIDLRFIANADYDQKMTSIINSGEPFDICFTADWANSYAINSNKGAFVDLKPYLDGNYKALKDAVDSKFWEGVTVRNKIFAVPANKELPYAPKWAFTKELVNKYKMDLSKVTDLESLEPCLKTIKEKEPNIVPLPLRATDIPGIIDNYDIPAEREMPAYVRYDDKTCTVVNPFKEEDVIKKLHTVNDYYKKGYINKDAATNKQKLKNRLIYCGFGEPGCDQVWGNQAGYEIISVPRWENYYATTSCTGSMQAVSANSKHKEEAVKFLQLLNTDSQIQNMITYGIEGVHYQKTSDTSIKLLPDSTKYTTDYYTLGNHFIRYTVDPQSKDLWNEYKKFNTDCKKSCIFGFSFNNDKVKTEYASVKNITAQYLPRLFTGSVSNVDQTLKEMNDKLDKAGMQKIIGEMQSQINTWKASK